MLAYGKPPHFFRFGVDSCHFGSGASGSRISAANVDPSILLAAGENFPFSWRTAGGGKDKGPHEGAPIEHLASLSSLR